MIKALALVIVAFLVGLCRPTFKLNVEAKVTVRIRLPIMAVTVITAFCHGNVALAFLAELAGWFVAGFLACRKQKLG